MIRDKYHQTEGLIEGYTLLYSALLQIDNKKDIGINMDEHPLMVPKETDDPYVMCLH